MSSIIKIILSATVLLLMAWFYYGVKSSRKNIPAAQQTSQPAKLTEVQVFATEAGWGYAIYRKGKPYIKQSTIPAVEGNKGFSSREKALQTAQLVAYKIENSILPPTISRQELDSLHVLN